MRSTLFAARRLPPVLALAVATVAIARIPPATAITFGERDGNRHPNVGAIVGLKHPDPTRPVPFIICSGTLIQERVMLTAGHCTDAMQQAVDLGEIALSDVRVSFDAGNAFDPSTWLEVQRVVTHPDYNPHLPDVTNPDVGVLILRDTLADPKPASLPDIGFLDTLKDQRLLRHGPDRTQFTVVGYGSGLLWPPPQVIPADGVRRFGGSGFKALHHAWLLLSQNQATGNAGTGIGDSGGPVLWQNPDGSEVLVATTSWGDPKLVSMGFYHRVDLAITLDFLRDVIHGLD